MQDSTSRVDLNALVNTLFKFLNDDITAANAQSSLQILLRTEGKVMVDAVQVAKLCHHWALKRHQETGVPIFQSFCTCLLRIYQAEAFCALPAFQLNVFIKPFLNELFRLCPPEERDTFKEELPGVKLRFQKLIETETQKRMPEYEVQFRVDDSTQVTESEWIQITNDRFQQILAELKQLVDSDRSTTDSLLRQFREIIPRIKETFQNIIHEQAIKERLTELIMLGRDLFNRREIEPANILFSYAAEVVEQRRDQFLEKEIASIMSLDSLDNQIIEEYMADPAHKRMLKPVFSNIFDTRPNTLLSSLVQEEDSDRRKRLLNFLTVYEPEIFYKILEELHSQNLTKWYYLRNLLVLLNSVTPPEDASLATVLDVIRGHLHPDSHPTLIKEAMRCYLRFAGDGGTELILSVLDAKHVSEVIRLDKFYPPQQLDEFVDNLIGGAASFDFSPHPRSIRILLDAIKAELDKATVIMGKIVMGLDQRRVTRLITLLSSTQSAFVQKSLQDFANNYKISAVQTVIQQTLAEIQKGRKAFF